MTTMINHVGGAAVHSLDARLGSVSRNVIVNSGCAATGQCSNAMFMNVMIGLVSYAVPGAMATGIMMLITSYLSAMAVMSLNLIMSGHFVIDAIRK